MKTAEDKAIDLLDKVRVQGAEYNKLLRAMTLAIKEQDRDTRHACALAVIACPEDVSGQCIWKDAAHSACMNVKAC